MITVITGILFESWKLLLEMSPYLLFGFIVAGILHATIPAKKISRHFSGTSTASVVKASVIGIPLPLCSCGVIPVATHLRKQGASRGPVLSFLISTPTTGVDSILATYSLMGIIFTIFRIIAAFFTGIFSGIIVNIFNRDDPEAPPDKAVECAFCSVELPHSHSLGEKFRWVVNYAFSQLVKDIGGWLLIGILIGGVIGYIIPEGGIEQYLGSPVAMYLLMFVVGTPLYVCATGSIPIAAALILKGLSPGAALVFLIVGPATNTTTIAIVGKLLGKKTLLIYIVVLIACALAFGIALDVVWSMTGNDISLFVGEPELLPHGIKLVSAIILLVLIAWAFIPTKFEKGVKGMSTTLKVPDMSCEHCKNTIRNTLMQNPNIEAVIIDLDTKTVEVGGTAPREEIISSINKAGYEVEEESTK